MAFNRTCSTAGTVLWIALLGLPTVAWAQQQSPRNYGPHMWDGGWHGWFSGPIMMSVSIAVAVVVVAQFRRKAVREQSRDRG